MIFLGVVLQVFSNICRLNEVLYLRSNEYLGKTYFERVTAKLTLNFRKKHICVFPGCFNSNHFFGYFLLLLEIKTKFIKFCTKFYVKQVNFCRLHVLVCCCAANQYSEIASIFSKNLKNRARSRGNETKLTSENDFIADLFALGGEKNQNMTKEPYFEA